MEPRSAPVAELIGAIENWDPVRLAAILPSPDVQDFVCKRVEAFGGTVHHRMLSKVVAMAEHDHSQWAVPVTLQCARLLRLHGALVEDMKGSFGPVATLFLSPTSRWYPSPHSLAIAQEMRAYIDAGLLDPKAAPAAGNRDGALPLRLALQGGHPAAVQVLLDVGADLADAMRGTGFRDPIDFVRKRNPPNAAEVVSVLAAHAMRQRLPSARPDVPLIRRRLPGV